MNVDVDTAPLVEVDDGKTIIINTEEPTAIKITSGSELELVPESHPILKKPTIKVPFDDPDVDPIKLTEDLLLTAKANKALGLAANQCGLPYSAFAMGDGNSHFVIINPEVLSVSEELVHMQEGCLSFPLLLLSISRPKEVEVRFQDFNGNFHTKKFSGLSARIFLHEMDHLKGITFDTVAKPLALKKGRTSRDKMIKRYAKNYVNQYKIKQGIV